MQKLIITAAICGAEVTKEHSKYVPYTAEEIAEEAERCVEAGASVIHLHVRKDDGKPTQDKYYFARAIFEIRERCWKMPIIQPSTGGAVGMALEERVQPVSLKPEMATLDCGTMNFYEDIFVNDIKMMRKFAEEMKKYSVKPEFEVFDTSGIEQSKILIKEGLVEAPFHYNLVFGVQGGMAATAKNLVFMTELLPLDSTWTVTAVGKHQIPMNTIGLVLGGNCRVGLEDNIYYSKGRKARGSYELVRKIAKIAKSLGREVASPDEAREILGLVKNGKSV